uniref:HSF-type DNA-binding domain-containing protein n=1 Tax=Anopheles melas TaxID=34690 RepID=A0A182TFL9_9DIPT
MPAADLNIGKLHLVLEMYKMASNPGNDSLQWSADGSLLIVNLPALALHLIPIVDEDNPLIWFLQLMCGAGFVQCPLEAVDEAEYNTPPDTTVIFWHPQFHRHNPWFNYTWIGEHYKDPQREEE